ncbi:ribosome maturation factor RimP [Fusobacterium animalis]|uniref:ribosome maturation factor RimP n=1 Tax=Fusobacterium animalis TaxID=76859 RepID=UPI0030D38BF2
MEGNNQIVEKITEIVNPFVVEMNLSLVDVEYVQDGAYWYIRIFIENLNGDLSIEDCSKLSSKIEDKIEKLIEHKFFLEVSSPGLERPLKKIEDYIRFIGEKITLHLKHKLDDKKQFKAIIKEVNGNNIIFLIDNKEIEIKFNEIRKANILFEFNDF